MTIEAAAARVDMDAQKWEEIEAGTAEIALDTLSALSIALGVDPSELLSERPERSKHR
jgi:transcriptional regulator with XRE-family HTH domain